MKLYQHRVINWDHMTLSVGGDVKAYFDDHPGLADLVSMHHKYVEDWVRVFYATVCTADTREYIMFMFQGCQYTLFRHHIVDKLGLRDFKIRKYNHKTSYIILPTGIVNHLGVVCSWVVPVRRGDGRTFC
jgi:hypothetical protein